MTESLVKLVLALSILGSIFIRMNTHSMHDEIIRRYSVLLQLILNMMKHVRCYESMQRRKNLNICDVFKLLRSYFAMNLKLKDRRIIDTYSLFCYYVPLFHRKVTRFIFSFQTFSLEQPIFFFLSVFFSSIIYFH